MSNNLAESFNVEDVRKEIKTFKEIFNEIKEIPNPDQTVAAAIDKAAIILDLVHSEMENEGASARYAEVAAQLINTIIQSSSLLNQSIQRLFDNKMKEISSDQKDRELDIKEKDVEIKKLYYKGSSGEQSNNNIIVTDTKSILKFLENKNKECINET
jgi:hypothetical protein